MGGGHALAGVGIAVETAHPELEQGTEQRHFLGADLAGGEEGDGMVSVLLLDGLHARGELVHGTDPRHRFHAAGDGIPQQRSGGAIGRVRRGQRLPTLGAGHAEVHRVLRIRAEVDRLAIAQVRGQAASGGTVTAGDGRGGIGLEL
jgi:hypothetical protein